MNLNRICVGVDGSPASQSALRWAAAEAAAHNAELVVIHAYDWRVVGAGRRSRGAIADVAKTDGRVPGRIRRRAGPGRRARA